MWNVTVLEKNTEEVMMFFNRNVWTLYSCQMFSSRNSKFSLTSKFEGVSVRIYRCLLWESLKSYTSYITENLLIYCNKWMSSTSTVYGYLRLNFCGQNIFRLQSSKLFRNSWSSHAFLRRSSYSIRQFVYWISHWDFFLEFSHVSFFSLNENGLCSSGIMCDFHRQRISEFGSVVSEPFKRKQTNIFSLKK